MWKTAPAFFTATALAVVTAIPADAAVLFAPAQSYTATLYGAGYSSATTVSADFNGDGFADLAVTDPWAGLTQGGISVLLNQGDGSFGPRRQVATLLETYTLDSGDFDRDGSPDLVGVSDSGVLVVLRNNGDATFSSVQRSAVPAGSQQVVSADVNGDGDPDLLVGGFAQVAVLLGGPGASFPLIGTGIQINGEATGLVADDFDRDGRIDLAVELANGGGNSYLGDGNGGFTQAGTLQIDSTAEGMTAGDVTGDGIVDLVTVSVGANVVRVLQGNGDGSFTSLATYPASYPVGATIADFDRDGRADVAISENSPNTAGARVAILAGTGGGQLAPAGGYPVDSNPGEPVAADVDGDGRLDLAVAAGTGPALWILRNTSN